MLGMALAEVGDEDESIRPFEMTVLHPGRTFVEKDGPADNAGA
jgi:hypothetical protein